MTEVQKTTMKIGLLGLASSLIGSCLIVGCAVNKESTLQPISSELLLSATESWGGETYNYPAGAAQLTMLRITIQPGAKTPLHSHPQPGMAYLVKGRIICKMLESGLTKQFESGDAFGTSSRNEIHYCENNGNEEALAFVGYAGVEGLPVTTPYPEDDAQAAESNKK